MATKPSLKNEGYEGGNRLKADDIQMSVGNVTSKPYPRAQDQRGQDSR
jgi:hypothetical protein